MSLAMFLLLLAAFSTLSGLLTEGVKLLLQDFKITCPANLLALIISLLTGVCGSLAAYAYLGIAYTAPNLLTAFFMGIANWLCSMVGYDKITQALSQLSGLRKKS